MRRSAAALALLTAAPAVAHDHAPLIGTEWALRSLAGAPFEARATLALHDGGRAVGAAPCNRFSGSWEAEGPDGGMFAAGPFAASRMACPDLAAESAFFAALDAAVRARLEGERLILIGADGAEAVFEAIGPAPQPD